MTYNVINFPTLTDISRSYIITTLIKSTPNLATNAYATSIRYNTLNGSPSSATYSIKFSTTPSNVLSTAGSTNVGSIISQTISYIYQSDSSFAFSNISLYNS